MTISDDIKAKIQAEYDSWQDEQYAGKDKKERQTKGQFFTPPPLTVKMLEKFDSIENKTMLDPTVGAGGLLAAAIIAGADPKKCYGIELDPVILKIAQLRLARLGVPPWHLKQGDALDPASYDKFDKENPEEDSTPFAVVAKFKQRARLLIVSNGKLFKEMSFSKEDKEKLKQAILKIKARGIKIVKIV